MTNEVINHEDFLIHRSDIYVGYLRERFEHYLQILFKKGPHGQLLPLGTAALTEQQEFITLRTLSEQARLVAAGQAQPTPPVQAFMQDPAAQARLIELAVKFTQGASNA